MINDLIQCIQQENIREELLEEKIDTVICYPGAGADIYPCAVIEKIDSEKLGIPNYKDKSVLYLFCDPRFTMSNICQNSDLYGEYIQNLIDKEKLDIGQLLEICNNSNLYPKAYSAFENNIEKMMSFMRIDFDIENNNEGYYYKIVIGGKICHILMIACDVSDFWLVLEKYKVRAEGVFLWDIHNWSIGKTLVNVTKEYLPKWIIGNRPAKNGSLSQLYTRNQYDEEIKELICGVRGIRDEIDKHDEKVSIWTIF